MSALQIKLNLCAEENGWLKEDPHLASINNIMCFPLGLNLSYTSLKVNFLL